MLDSSALVVSASEAPAQPNVFGFEHDAHDAHECTGTDTYTDAHTHAHAQSSNLKPENFQEYCTFGGIVKVHI